MRRAVRLRADANYEAGEYAILLRSNLKGRGQGWTPMEMSIAYVRNEDLRRIEGQAPRENSVMLHMLWLLKTPKRAEILEISAYPPYPCRHDHISFRPRFAALFSLS